MIIDEVDRMNIEEAENQGDSFYVDDDSDFFAYRGNTEDSDSDSSDVEVLLRSYSQLDIMF